MVAVTIQAVVFDIGARRVSTRCLYQDNTQAVSDIEDLLAR